MVARCKEDILKARGVKPTLSPNLNTLATVEALDVKRLLFIGVGCQVHFEHPYAFPPTLCDNDDLGVIWLLCIGLGCRGCHVYPIPNEFTPFGQWMP